MKKFLNEITPYIIIIVVVVLIRTYVVTPVTVDGPSMEETLYTNDIMLLYKYNKKNIKRYDIIVFNYNNSKLVKRLIALPGERIKCERGIILINDEDMSNEYGYGDNKDFEEITLKEDEYFVMGDNREDSLDSRVFGPIHMSQILGNTNLIIFPVNHLGFVE